MPAIIPMVILGTGVFLLTCSVAVIGYGIVRYFSNQNKDLEMVPEEF